MEFGEVSVSFVNQPSISLSFKSLYTNLVLDIVSKVGILPSFELYSELGSLEFVDLLTNQTALSLSNHLSHWLWPSIIQVIRLGFISLLTRCFDFQSVLLGVVMVSLLARALEETRLGFLPRLHGSHSYLMNSRDSPLSPCIYPCPYGDILALSLHLLLLTLYSRSFHCYLAGT